MGDDNGLVTHPAPGGVPDWGGQSGELASPVTLTTEAASGVAAARSAQLGAPEQPGRSSGRWSSLPRATTRLIGRDHELAALREQIVLPDVRLLTLVGSPGVGKTRLGLGLAQSVTEGFVDGVVFVPLAALATAESVGPVIAQALGIVEQAHRPVVESLIDQLRDRSVLLLLDNFEHVLDAASTLAELLVACAGLKLLVTSRASTRLSGEREVLVQPLGVPTLAQLPSVEALVETPSVALFVERAQASRPDFGLTSENAASVAEICVRLDGLPLAIELAAARARVMTPQDLLARLVNALPLLTRGPSSLSPRHRTLRDAITWSYDLLRPTEQVLFRRLAVFSGGWTLGAAEVVCGSAIESPLSGVTAGPDLDPVAVLDGLTTLVEHSLVERDPSSTENSRFRMLETIHAYAWERLGASGEDRAVRRRHADYVLGLAQASTTPFVTTENVAALARLDADRDNVRAALRWCAGEDGPTDLGLKIVAPLYWYWYARGHFVEGRRWLETMLSLDSVDPASGHARAWALLGTATMAWRQADYPTATRRGEEAIAVFRRLAAEPGIGLALITLGVTAMFSGDFQRAERLMDETLAHGRATSDDFVVNSVLHNMARLAWFQGDDARALALAEEVLPTTRRFANTSGSAYVLNLMASIARNGGALDRAEALLGESMAGFTAMRDTWGVSCVLDDQGLLSIARGRHGQAATLLRSSLERSRDLDDAWLMPQTIAGLALLATRLDLYEPAARLFGAAEGQRAAIGAVFPAADRFDHERALAKTRQVLDSATFDAGWVVGRTMSLGRAVADALELSRELAAVAPSARRGMGRVGDRALTRREREVAALIAAGLTSREIGERLVIAERTVDSHAEHIREKLGLRSRQQIAAWAVQQGLVGPDSA